MYVVISVAKGYTQYFENLQEAKESAQRTSGNASCDMIVASNTERNLRRLLVAYSDGALIFERVE